LRQTLAIAEDEPDLLEALEDYFTRAGFDVIAATDAATFRQKVTGRQVHLALLDITMPGEDGLSLARWLKAQGPVGLILATALGRPIDRVVGLDIGADDYVVKPYDLRELLARLRSVSRRLGGAVITMPVDVGGSPQNRAPSLKIGTLILDPDQRALIDPSGAVTTLSTTEFGLLATLVGKSGQIVSRQTLAATSGDPSDRAIDVRIARLRKKLAALDARSAALLRTVRGEGYALDDLAK
jgi:DNA-binding response OmpR family regulator